MAGCFEHLLVKKVHNAFANLNILYFGMLKQGLAFIFPWLNKMLMSFLVCWRATNY